MRLSFNTLVPPLNTGQASIFKDRGTYPRLFKRLFDLIGQDALIDTPVLLAAAGGSEPHAPKPRSVSTAIGATCARRACTTRWTTSFTNWVIGR